MKHFPIYTTINQPEGSEKFAQTPQRVFDSLASGNVGFLALALFAAMHLRCNFHSGKGVTTIREICEMLRLNPSEKNRNTITKEVLRMREQKLLWYPRRTGSKTFVYVLFGYKFKEINDTATKYIDIEKYFHNENQNAVRTSTEASSGLVPRSPPKNQNFERPQNGSIKSIGDLLSER